MLKRIRIQGYKSLANLDITLGPLAVLFGPNAAGKSNFLDALQLVSRLATSRTLNDAFQPPYRGTPLESFSFDRNGIEGLLRRDSVRMSFEVDVELSNAVVDAVNRRIREMKRTRPGESTAGNGHSVASVRERSLRYRIEIEILPRSGVLRVTDEYLTALNAKGEPTGKRKPFIEKMKTRFHLRMEGQSHPSYFDRHLDHSILSLSHYPPHHPHLVAMREELASWFFFYFEPRERMRSVNPVKEVRHIGLMGEDLAAFLNTLKSYDEKQFIAVERALRTIVPTITGIDVHVNNLGEVELGLREGTTPIPARVLSEGTLRVLGLLALIGVKDSPALIGFEEPENGIHPRRIRLIAEMFKTQAKMGKSQMIVTTHSPILPDLLPNDALYICRKVENVTSILQFTETWGSLGRKKDIDAVLDDEDPLSISDRILRGDFDA